MSGMSVKNTAGPPLRRRSKADAVGPARRWIVRKDELIDTSSAAVNLVNEDSAAARMATEVIVKGIMLVSKIPSF